MIHVRIAVERREAPRELAIVHADQLHMTCASVSDLSDPQIIYAAEWDGGPWITVLKGSIADLKLAYAGWPMVEEPL
jgi:hypothetical protein